MGKLFRQARGEVVLSADILDYYVKNAEGFLAPQPLKPGSGEASIAACVPQCANRRASIRCKDLEHVSMFNCAARSDGKLFADRDAVLRHLPLQSPFGPQRVEQRRLPDCPGS